LIHFCFLDISITRELITDGDDDYFDSSESPNTSDPNLDDELEPAPEIDGLENDLNRIIRVCEHNMI
jgi:hypothetical protein